MMWWKKFKVFPNLEKEIPSVKVVVEKSYVPEEHRLENSTERSFNSSTLNKVSNIEGAFSHDKEWADLMVELENSRLAAAVAKKASECALAELQIKYELATKLAEVEANGLIKSEQHKSQVATVLASQRSERKLFQQKLTFESAAVAYSNASNMKIAALKAESEIALKKLKEAELARVLEEDPQSAVFIANTARFVSEAMQKSELEAAVKEMTKENIKKMEAEQMGSWINARGAKEEFDSIVEKMRLQYEMAAAAATNASEQSMETLCFQTHLATLFAKKNFDSQLLSERAELKGLAESAEKYNAVMLANQQCKYESAADAREREFKSSMDLQLEDSQTLIDAFNVEMVAKDLKYVVAKLTGERLEQQILTNRLEQQAKMANKESELLLSVCGNVAHDLNSPLLTLVLGIESLRSTFPQSGDVFDTLDSACAFMTSAISRTIDFTKVSSGVGLTPYQTTFDLRLSLNNPFKWIKAMLPQDGSITLEFQPFPSDIFPMIISDQRWVEENLLCLLSNAVKYSSQGIVSAGVSLNKDKLRFTVEDNGIGIADHSKPMLFQQVSPVERKAVGGSGLGLYSLSKRSVAIGGSCGIDDRRSDGKPGSSFWFEVPYAPDSVCTPPQGFCPAESSSEESSLKQISRSSTIESPHAMHILIVDDSIAVVKMLSNKLKGSGHTVVTAKDGLEGLMKLKDMCDDLDLCIMDLQMPVMDGIESTEKYRSWERQRALDCPLIRSRLPIICSSANCSAIAEKRAIAAGVDSFLPKPFSMAALASALEQACSLSGQRNSSHSNSRHSSQKNSMKDFSQVTLLDTPQDIPQINSAKSEDIRTATVA